ncbi:MAG TPA: DNA mismatch repair protein MutL [Clostridiaceae bacterium]|nr:DNA mismatch repair protein MutL [Clostridiaceae bacterium]
MQVDLLVAEIGSTTTVASAFDGMLTDRPRLLGQGTAPTSMAEGDVTLGLARAREDLARKLGLSEVFARETFAASSAAGGLSMTVHGLVPEMTVRAAREAALGSGAVLCSVTSGRMRSRDVEAVRLAAPRIIMIAGGTDGGERETALYNFDLLSAALPHTPFLYAGNTDNRDELLDMAGERGVRLYVTDNVYPHIDELKVGPARRVIQDIFEEHIVEAPGMAHIREAVTGTIMPTPGAVMAMTELLYGTLGDLLTLDVGGATTDVHSVTWGSDNLRDFQAEPEPFAKRSVEGDLGVFVNRRHVLAAMTEKEKRGLPQDYAEKLAGVPALPRSREEEDLIRPLAAACCREGLDRHAGRISQQFTARGRTTLVRGRDLTAVGTVIATGGALTRLSGMAEVLRELLERQDPERLYPPAHARVMIDQHYLMASLGLMSRAYPEAAITLLLDSLKQG